MPWSVWGSGCIDSHFLDLGTSWEWSASRSGRFTPRGKSPRYPLDRRLGGLHNRSGREENSWPYWDSNSDPSVVQPVASRYTNSAIPAPNLPLRKKWIRRWRSYRKGYMYLNCYQNVYSEDSDPWNTILLHGSVTASSDPAAILVLPNYSKSPGGDRMGWGTARGREREIRGHTDGQVRAVHPSGTSLHSANNVVDRHTHFVLVFQTLSAFLYMTWAQQNTL
jgi:hypothetical protein